MKEQGVGQAASTPNAAPAQARPTVGKSTLMVGDHASPTPQLSLGGGQTAAGTTNTLDSLRVSVQQGPDAALTAYRALSTAGRTKLRADPALVTELLSRIASDDALAVLRELKLDRKTTLRVAAQSRFMDGPFLGGVLALLKLDTLAALSAAAADVAAEPVFVERYLLDPIINAASVTGKQQMAFATSDGGTTILRRLYPADGPLKALPKLAADQALLRDAYISDTDFGDWLLASPNALEAQITMHLDGGDWVRAMWGGRHEPILRGWIVRKPAYWGNACAEAFQKPQPSDASALGARRELRGAIFDAIAFALSIDNLFAVFHALKMALGEWITALQDANRLNAANLQLALDGPRIGPADHQDLAEHDEAVGLVRKLSAGKRPSETLTMLASDTAKFCEAVGHRGAFFEWVTSTPALLADEMTSVVDWPAWVQAFKKANDPIKLLDVSAYDPSIRLPLRGALTKTASWTWFLKSLPQPVPEQTQVHALFGLFHDGSGIAVADKYLMWTAIYSKPLKRAGDVVVIPWTAPDKTKGEQRYIGTNPSDATMNSFFEMYRQMPRTHVETAESIIMAQHYTLSAGKTFYGDDLKPKAAPGLNKLTTSLIHANHVIMRAVDGAGNADTTINGDNYANPKLPGMAPGAVNRSKKGLANPDLSYFKNHATHEIGHAVGNRTLKLGKYNITGNEFSKKYAQWKDGGDAHDYASMLGFSSGLDRQVHKVTAATVGGVPQPDRYYFGMNVRQFLTGIVEGGLASQAGHQIAKDAGGPKQGLLALKANSTIANTTLWKTVHHLSDPTEQLPNGAWQFPYGIDNADRVTMRASNRWQQYHGDAWKHRVSHYSMFSIGEHFAEIYTARFTSGTTPPKIGDNDPNDFFEHLERAKPTDLGLPETTSKSPGAQPDGNDGDAADAGATESEPAGASVPPARPWP